MIMNHVIKNVLYHVESDNIISVELDQSVR